MPATPFDARSFALSTDLDVPSFRTRNLPSVGVLVEGAKEPTDFGWWLLDQMAQHRPRLSQIDLARKADIGQATISRWIYDPKIRPDTHKLARLANALNVSHSEVLQRAGHGALRPVTITPEPLDATVAKLRLCLDPTSPLTDDERATLRQVVDGVLLGYERALRRRKRVS